MLWEDNPLVQKQLQYLFANKKPMDEDIYPCTISEILEAQANHLFNNYFEDT